jgi:hypothetical protein
MCNCSCGAEARDVNNINIGRGCGCRLFLLDPDASKKDLQLMQHEHHVLQCVGAPNKWLSVVQLFNLHGTSAVQLQARDGHVAINASCC